MSDDLIERLEPLNGGVFMTDEGEVSIWEVTQALEATRKLVFDKMQLIGELQQQVGNLNFDLGEVTTKMLKQQALIERYKGIEEQRDQLMAEKLRMQEALQKISAGRHHIGWSPCADIADKALKPQCRHDWFKPEDTDQITWGEYRMCKKCYAIGKPEG